MTYLNPKDPAIGKVHRERKSLTQHYLLWGWRDIEYRLTGRFAALRLAPRRNDSGVLVTPVATLAEAKGHDGSLLWSDQDGNHYPKFVPDPSIIWSEEIDWPVPPFEALQAGIAELMKDSEK